MRIRRLNESSDDENIFTDVNLLHDILQEYKDIGLNYAIEYNLQKYFVVRSIIKFHESDLLNTGHSINGFDSISFVKSDYSPKQRKAEINKCVKTYVIRFSRSPISVNGILTSDRQRSGSKYFTPSKTMYDFYEISKSIQGRIESMGHTFAISSGDVLDAVNNIMILEGEHK